MRDCFLTTARLGFSHWHPDDRPLAHRLWGDPEVTRLIVQGGVMTAAQIDARLADEIARQDTYGIQYFPLFLLAGGQFAGCCGLRPWPGPEEALELGFHLRPAFWRQGYAHEAATAMIGYAFRDLHAPALIAGHHPDNHRSQALLARLGFVHLRDDFYPPTGRYHPTYRLLP